MLPSRLCYPYTAQPGSVFTNHSGEHSQIFLYSEAYECNTTSDWLNHIV